MEGTDTKPFISVEVEQLFKTITDEYASLRLEGKALRLWLETAYMLGYRDGVRDADSLFMKSEIMKVIKK